MGRETKLHSRLKGNKDAEILFSQPFKRTTFLDWSEIDGPISNKIVNKFLKKKKEINKR